MVWLFLSYQIANIQTNKHPVTLYKGIMEEFLYHEILFNKMFGSTNRWLGGAQCTPLPISGNKKEINNGRIFEGCDPLLSPNIMFHLFFELACRGRPREG